MPKTVTQTTTSDGSITKVVDVNGVKTATTVGNTFDQRRANSARLDYATHKIWNPATSAFITVTMTGNEAVDVAAIAAAHRTAGARSNLVISST